MAISLGLGLGLMIWGMGFGSMMVTEANQLTWINLGVLTLGVMIATGGHFYISAWKAFKHHNANMDTLIALGAGTAWLYSMVVASAPEALPEMARHVYFEASAMIIGLINLGQARSCGPRARRRKRCAGCWICGRKRPGCFVTAKSRIFPSKTCRKAIASGCARARSCRWTG